MFEKLLSAVAGGQSATSVPADEWWTITFQAPVYGRVEPVQVHGVTYREAEQTRLRWRAGSSERVSFDCAGTTEPAMNAVLATGWRYCDITDLRIIPTREAL